MLGGEKWRGVEEQGVTSAEWRPIRCEQECRVIGALNGAPQEDRGVGESACLKEVPCMKEVPCII